MQRVIVDVGVKQSNIKNPVIFHLILFNYIFFKTFGRIASAVYSCSLTTVFKKRKRFNLFGRKKVNGIRPDKAGINLIERVMVTMNNICMYIVLIKFFDSFKKMDLCFYTSILKVIKIT